MPYKDPKQDLAWRRARYKMKQTRRSAWLRIPEPCPTCGERMWSHVGPRADTKACYHPGKGPPEFRYYVEDGE